MFGISLVIRPHEYILVLESVFEFIFWFFLAYNKGKITVYKDQLFFVDLFTTMNKAEIPV